MKNTLRGVIRAICFIWEFICVALVILMCLLVAFIVFLGKGGNIKDHFNRLIDVL